MPVFDNKQDFDEYEKRAASADLGLYQPVSEY